jgi:methyl-accepting chemotaxis protein
VIGLVLSLLVLLFFLENIKKEVYKSEVKILHHELDDRVKAKTSIGLTNIISIANDTNIVKALENRDVVLADKVLSNLSKKFKSKTKFKNIKVHIHTKDNKSFYRNWTNKRGDDISWRHSISTVNKKLVEVSTFEVGRAGLSIKSVVPLITDSGKHIGSVEFIQGLNSVAKRFDKLNEGFLLLMNKSELSTAKFIKNPKELDNYIIAQKFISQKFLDDAKNIDFDILRKDNYFVTEQYLFTFQDVSDSSGKHIGIMLVGMNMSKVDKIIQSSSFMVYVALFLIAILMLGLTIVTRKTVIKPLKDVISRLSISTNEIKSSSQNLAQGAVSLADMSANQSASVEQITATVEQTSSNANSNVENMKQLVEFGRNMEVNTNQGYQHMIELKNSMNEISQSSKSINALVNTIDEIAFQTNLLALNAAVEAARAGEHGVGFAVVADEVRNLSQRSTNEAVKIHDVIEESVQQAQAGVLIADKTNSSFETILENIHSSAIVREQTLIASQEQQIAIEQLRKAMIEVDSVTQQLSANSEEVSALAEELSAQANSTNGVVADISRMV